MRTNKNTHTYRPATENAYRKTDRQYPQSKPLNKQPRKQRIVEILPKTITNQIQHIERIPTPIILGKSQKNQRLYHLQCQKPTFITQPNNQGFYDDTCLWNLQVANPIYKEQRRTITVSKASFMLTQWINDQYPSVIYLTADGIMGYFNSENKVTNRICALELSEISPIYMEGGHQECFDLRYEVQKSHQWQIPIGINDVCLRLLMERDEGKWQYVKLPLVNPVTVEILIQNK